MKQEFLKKNGTKALLLFFGGWGSAPKLFRDSVGGCGRDCLFCYDYKDCYFDFSLLEGSEEINLVAWSMGVWVAGQVFGGYKRCVENGKSVEHQEFERRITSTVAIGGTSKPIDDLYGIPTAVFEATLNKMSPTVLYKFRRRMCGADLAVFESRMPDRNAPSVGAGLMCVAATLFSLRLIKSEPGRKRVFPWKCGTVPIIQQGFSMKYSSETYFKTL